ncbi:hypothetical protein [Streptomyces sp. NPDC001054]
MAAINVGSVEVDVLPSMRGVYQRMQAGLVPPANRVGEEMGRVLGRRIATEVASGVQDGLSRGASQAQTTAARGGQRTGSAFARTLRATLEGALRNLPEVRLTANATDAEREIYQIREQIRTLSDARIGIDISSAEAVAVIERMQARLERLSASDANIQVRVDAASAAAELAGMQAAVNRLDGQTAEVNVRVDTGAALAALAGLTVALAGVAAIPAVPVLAAGLGSIAAAGVAASVGVGALAAVAVPAFKGIAGALQAQKAAQDAATTATTGGGAAASQAASKALQLAGAQQALATAHRNAARQIGQAEQGVADAERSAAEASRTAAQQVRQAKQSLADAVQQAADRQEAAAESVARAEESLADAQKSARQAQQDLTQARKDAAVELAALSDRLADAQLSERDAVLDVQEAQEKLRATQAVGSKATLLEQQRAQLQLDQATQRLKEQKQETKDLAAQKAAADKAGVEGSETVRSAQERLAAAQESVGDQQKALAKAQADAARQQVDNTKAIAAAQDKVAEAQRNVARTQEDGARAVARAQQQLVTAQESAADSIASAQRQIQSAQLSTASSTSTASSAQTKYNAALADLSPAARATFDAVGRLKAAFTSWSEALQPQVMPIFTRAIDGLRKSLPALTPFVVAAAAAVSDLQDRFSRNIRSPWMKSFVTDLRQASGPAITGLGVAFGNVLKGMAGIIDAFLPHMDAISSEMQRITARFADWGTSLKGSPEFESFLAYAARMAPVLASALGSIAEAGLRVAQALSPLSGPAIEALGKVASAIGWIAEHAPWAVQGLYLLYVATKLWTIATVAAAAAQRAWAIAVGLFNLAMRVSPIGWVLTLIGLLVTAVTLIATKTDWFQKLWRVAWGGIKVAASQTWDHVLKPSFEGIKIGLSAIGTGALHLWRGAIRPAFNGIAAGARVLWSGIDFALVTPMREGARELGGMFSWLWREGIKPSFDGISAGARVLGVAVDVLLVKPMRIAVAILGDSVRGLWVGAVKPTFDGIAASARWLYIKAIKPVFNGISAVVKFWWKVNSAIFKTAVAFVRNVLGPAFKWLYDKAVKPALNGIRSAVSSWWRNTKANFQAAVDFVRRTLGPVFTWLRDKIIKPVWSGIKSTISTTYTRGIRPVFEGLKTAVKAVGTAFERAKDAIKKAWDKLKGIAKAPVNFIIGTVYNGGIKKVWDKVVSAFGGTKLPKVNTLATGGVLPGYTPGKDIHLAALSGGEAVMRPEWTRAVGPQYVDAMNRAARGGGVQGVQKALGVPGFSLGGIFKGIGNVASSAWDKAKAGASWLKDTFGAAVRSGASKVINPLISQIPGDGGVTKLLKSLAKAAVKSLVGAGKKGDEEGGGGALGGVIPTGRRKAIISQALAAAHVPPPGTLGQWLAGMNTLITRESGWNASAINRWDTNAMMGMPSQGLAQTIPSTFAAYVPKSLRSRGILDPVANVAAAVRYIVSRYGNITRVQQANANRPPAGYDSGGYLQPGLNLAYNGTGRPEPVFTRQQASALMSRAATGPTSGVARFEGDLYLDSGEFLGRVRGEAADVMQQGQRDLLSAIRAS